MVWLYKASVSCATTHPPGPTTNCEPAPTTPVAPSGVGLIAPAAPLGGDLAMLGIFPLTTGASSCSTVVLPASIEHKGEKLCGLATLGGHFNGRSQVLISWSII